MRDLFRFLFRQRDNLLFLLLLVIGLSMTIKGNMHQRAEWISSSSAAVGRIYTWRNGVMEFADLRQNNADLNLALARERERNTSISSARDSVAMMNDSVRQLRYRFLTAQVINSTVHKAKNYLTLDKGKSDGIKENMGVIGPNGIVGMVREASAHFASVMSVLNENHVASAQLKSTKNFGLLRWNTGDPHTVSLGDIDKHVPVHIGDTVETSGFGDIYPKGIMVGMVESVTEDQSIPFHVITVRLSEDLTRAGHVQVVTDLMKAERDSLEATAPQE